MRFIDFCMADPGSVKFVSDVILEHLGEPSTKPQRKALTAYHVGDSTQLTQLLSLNLGDPYLRCLRYLNSAAKSSDPETAGEFMDKAIEIITSQNKKASDRKPDRLTESCDRIFRTMLEN